MLELLNTAVTWDATYDGFTPHLSEQATALLRNDKEAIPRLLALLQEPDAFVAAHVGLTLVGGLSYSTFPTWNGLKIGIESDGTIFIDPEQRHQLAKRWQAWYSSSPRLTTLPHIE